MARTILLMVAGLTAALASAAEMSGQATRQPKRVCFRGRPEAFCRAFWITEAGYYRRVAGSSSVPPSSTVHLEFDHLHSHLAWEIGGMVNRGPATAVGATLLLAPINGERVSVKGRYRRWLGQDETTLDFSAGLLRANSYEPGQDIPPESYGLTGDVSLGWGDWVAVTARAEMLRRGDGRRITALYGGARLGSYPAVIGTVVGAIVIGLLIAAILSGCGNC